MMDKKDSKAIHDLFAEFHYADDLGVIKSKVVDYVTTVRKEAREAAFGDAVKWAKKVETVKRNAARDASADDEFAAMRLAHEADGVKRVIETLEAAANKEKGAGDG